MWVHLVPSSLSCPPDRLSTSCIPQTTSSIGHSPPVITQIIVRNIIPCCQKSMTHDAPGDKAILPVTSLQELLDNGTTRPLLLSTVMIESNPIARSRTSYLPVHWRPLPQLHRSLCSSSSLATPVTAVWSTSSWPAIKNGGRPG